MKAIYVIVWHVPCKLAIGEELRPCSLKRLHCMKAYVTDHTPR
ncbi:MAG: hypothetical protein QOJ45_2453 [Verrucomicrobiota bacterium]